MTDNERARVLDQLTEKVVDAVSCNRFRCENLDAVAPILATALRDERRRAVEGLTKKLRRECLHEHSMKPTKLRMIDCDRCIELCRQADEETHG